MGANGSTPDVAAHWEKDQMSEKCRDCDEEFTFKKRRHHCRACGQLYCESCTFAKLDMSIYGYGKGGHRSCKQCADFLPSIVMTRSRFQPFNKQLQCISKWNLLRYGPFHYFEEIPLNDTDKLAHISKSFTSVLSVDRLFYHQITPVCFFVLQSLPSVPIRKHLSMIVENDNNANIGNIQSNRNTELDTFLEEVFTFRFFRKMNCFPIDKIHGMEKSVLVVPRYVFCWLFHFQQEQYVYLPAQITVLLRKANDCWFQKVLRNERIPTRRDMDILVALCRQKYAIYDIQSQICSEFLSICKSEPLQRSVTTVESQLRMFGSQSQLSVTKSRTRSRSRSKSNSARDQTHYRLFSLAEATNNDMAGMSELDQSLNPEYKHSSMHQHRHSSAYDQPLIEEPQPPTAQSAMHSDMLASAGSTATVSNPDSNVSPSDPLLV